MLNPSKESTSMSGVLGLSALSKLGAAERYSRNESRGIGLLLVVADENLCRSEAFEMLSG